MKHNTIRVFIGVVTLFSLLIISCDEDFNSVGSEVINGIGFENRTYISKPLAYTIDVGEVQTNGLPYYSLGTYNDPTYGALEYDFLGQVALPLSTDPNSTLPLTFDFDNVKTFDSVVLYLPYFSRVTEPANTAENSPAEYDLTIGYGDNTAVFGLNIYRSNYFLSNFDPQQNENGQIGDRRAYFSNDLIEFESSLKFEPISTFEVIVNREDSTRQFKEKNDFLVSTEAIANLLPDDNDEDLLPSLTFLTPGLYVHLDTLKFNEFFLKEDVNFPSPNNRNNFLNFFRGLYVDFEKKSDNKDVLFAINTSNASLNFYFTEVFKRESKDSIGAPKTISLRFNGNNINGIQEKPSFTIPDANVVDGDANLFLKGGKGSYATIELLSDRIIVDENENAVLDENGNFQITTENLANSIPEIEFLQSQNWIINDAKLRFYVNQDALRGQDTLLEPERIFIFDLETGARLTDFCNDIALQFPNVENHLPPLERDNNGNGVFYDVNLTNYLNNVLLGNENLSTLGIAVSQDVSRESINDVDRGIVCGPLTPREVKNSERIITATSVISPEGTILYGNTQEVPEDKRLELIISYSQSIRE
ncbi:DUF4270 domain-containing protein [Aquimarina sp. ERC-38]|uniref:DUF4270 family protein n=1 Tax=Aquimarina sp. ERC-38 TaxID=2949996 RepID=UPI0022475FE3|nr:DUF4270 family protein [Aquimarina sp. ERC-38]UZO82161.1 DUF4270 domain-containing protein [Aquimarina sp. ERC-38]